VDELFIMDSASKERKEVVVIGTDDDEEDCSNQRDASVSGVGELRNMLKRGTHASISVCFLPWICFFLKKLSSKGKSLLLF
jgi:hypothetical protein